MADLLDDPKLAALLDALDKAADALAKEAAAAAKSIERADAAELVLEKEAQ